MKKPTRPTRRATPRRLPSKTITVLDRQRIAWQDPSGTWHGNRTSDDVSLCAGAPVGFDISLVLEPEHSYLWIGIAAPDTHAARACYATIGDHALHELARNILRYAPKGGRR